VVIVSLTSTSNRLEILHYTLLSLLAQSYKADRIVLNISREPYLLDDGIQELPNQITGLINSGVEVNWVKNNGSYRKLFPVLQEADNDDLIVTCDDDVIYGSGWLKSLVRSANSNPDKIVCGRARKPIVNVFNQKTSYTLWPLVDSNSIGHNLVPIGVGGIVYRKKLLDLDFLLDEKFSELAPMQDDLWFKLASFRLNVQTLVAKNVNEEVYEIESPITLSASNAAYQDFRGGFLLTNLRKVYLKIRAYLGFAVCKNDEVLKKLSSYSQIP